MLKRSSDAIAKWKGFDDAIDRWLDERHLLIIQLSDFADHQDFSNPSPQIKGKIQTFTALLIDYISAGHFKFYQRLVDEGMEFGDLDAATTAAPLLEAIDLSTQSTLDFNEKYEQLSNLSDYASDLSNLAESLVNRFDAEDQMINTLHKAHLRQITA